MAEKHETVVASDPEARIAKGHSLKPELALAALRRAWDDCPKPERDRFLRAVLQEQKPRRLKGDEEWLIELGRRLRAIRGVKDWA
jgi:hypothetical protein